MIPDSDSTIIAIASAQGAALRGIVRLSGRGVREVLGSRFSPLEPERWLQSKLPRRHPGTWNWSETGSRPVPVSVSLWPGRRSYTAEPLAEIHTIGSPPLLDLIVSQCCQNGARLAQPGEFTLRAFLNGRIDLIQAEAVAGVIEASNQKELAHALDQLAGGLSGGLKSIRSGLLDLLADLEAGLDFSDEGIRFLDDEVIVSRLGSWIVELDRILDRTTNRTLRGTMPRVVLAGPANAGKSTLFNLWLVPSNGNLLAEGSRAIISEHAGTTRDYLEAPVPCQGLTFLLVDTAGFDDSSDELLLRAFMLRDDQITRSDLVVWCDPEGRTPPFPALVVQTKSDLSSRASTELLAVSARTGQGIDQLKQRIVSALSQPESDSPLVATTAVRCLGALEQCRDSLIRARELVGTGQADELLAIEVRESLDRLAEVAGNVHTDDILGRVFSRFCIGK